MSDQPKPAVEWKPETVMDLASLATKSGDSFKIIADAHNAALAAYKQQAESMLATSKRVNDQLREQLAAERERHRKGMEAVTMNTSDIETVQQLRSQVQTLVDALEEAANKIEEVYQFHISGDPCHLIEMVEKLRALAKVKEGK